MSGQLGRGECVLHMEGPMLGKMARGARAWRLTCTHRRERRVAPDKTRAASLQKEPTKKGELKREPNPPLLAASAAR